MTREQVYEQAAYELATARWRADILAPATYLAQGARWAMYLAQARRDVAEARQAPRGPQEGMYAPDGTLTAEAQADLLRHGYRVLRGQEVPAYLARQQARRDAVRAVELAHRQDDDENWQAQAQARREGRQA